MKRLIPLLAIVSLIGCTKVVAHSKDRPTTPVSQTFNHVVPHTYLAAKQALENKGYAIQHEEKTDGLIKTKWLATKSTSHYVDLFGRRDYGTIGAYYQLHIQIAEVEGKSKVTISAPARSLIHRIRSAHFEEKKVLREMANLLRREDFELTNVGASE